MSQATHGLSPSGDDCNGARREHFDATLAACGEAVASLINTSPRTPTAEQITDLIQNTLKTGFESDEAVALDDDTVGRSDDPDDPLNFKGVQFKFEETNTDFAKINLPAVRLAFKFLEKDREAAVEALRKMISDGNADLINHMLEGWEVTGGKFEAIAAFLETARVRMEIARRHIEGAAP